MTTTAQSRRERAHAIAAKCADAYSATRYRNWHEVARVLLRMGFNDAEVEAVMRSKITRWAADFSGRDSGQVPARVVRDYIEHDEARKGWRVRAEIAEWAREYAA